MASVPHRVEPERAIVPPIVLPITSRGLVVTDRLCWMILAAAMAVAGGLILYLNRGTIFFLDELTWVYSSPSLDARDVIEPHNGHLIATTRLAYKAVLETLGADYLTFRLLHVSTLLVAVGLLYVLAKRRIGALPALAPCFVLLVFGSAAHHLYSPVAFSIFLCIAAGLGALVALERGDRRGDVAACALIALSVATFTTGLAFLVGVAISVLIRPDRWRRAWVFIVPLALYTAWWVWAQSQPDPAGETARLSNSLLIPSYVAESLAVVTNALAGLDFDFPGSPSDGIESGWGRVLAAAAVVALALRIRRGSLPASLWVSLGIVLTFWALGALAFDAILRAPGNGRYLFMGAVGVLLVATDAARSIRFSRLGLLALFAGAAFSVATNVAILRDGAAFFRDGYSTPARAEFAMLELARDRVDPDVDAAPAGSESPLALPGLPAGPYLAVVDRYGSLGLTLPELERESEGVRQHADRTLARILELGLEPSRAGTPDGGCLQLRTTEPDGPIGFRLPPGGAILRARGAAPAAVTVGRFAVPSAEVGSLVPGEAATLGIPTDWSSRPWLASIGGAESVEVCPAG
jgi:hypothetical protein